MNEVKEFMSRAFQLFVVMPLVVICCTALLEKFLERFDPDG